MKNLFLITLLLVNVTLLSAKNEGPVLNSTSEFHSMNEWENVKVFYSSSEVQNMEKGSLISKTINTSLNFASKTKIKSNCLIELQKKALKLGYDAILIDEKNSSSKRYNKRGIKVTLVAHGYKS